MTPILNNSMTAPETNKNRYFSYLALVVILLLGSYVRATNLSWGVPELHPFMGRYMEFLYPDEPNLVQQIRGMLANPLDNAPFIYPPLQAQIGAAFAWALGLTTTSSLYLLARWISVVASAMTIAATYFIGRFWSVRIAIIASAFLAVTMTSVREAHWANPESLAALLITLALFVMYRFCAEESTVLVLVMSIILALAICAKYQGVFFLHLPAIAVGTLWFDREWPHRKSFYKLAVCYGVILAIVGILLVPYIISNKETFEASFSYLRGWITSSNGLYGTFPNPVQQPHYTSLILPVALGFPIYILALGGIITSLLIRHKPALLLLFGILPYWIALELLHYRPIRFSVSLLPGMCIFAAIVIDRALCSQKRFLRIVGSLALVATLIYSLAYSFAFTNALNPESDVRLSIENWIQQTHPNRERISMLAHNLSSNSVGFIKYTTIEHFNGESYDFSQQQPDIIVVPKVFLEVLQQCLDLGRKGYVYSDADWWPIQKPTLETLDLAEDLIEQRTYKIARAFKNEAEFGGHKFRDDVLKFDYFWVSNLEILVFQRQESQLKKL
jgi:Dolichyl-phosphate-mannose-protein mannosyltransferase